MKKIDPQTRDEVKIMLGKLNSILERSEWFAGDELSIADFGFIASVGTIKVFHLKLLLGFNKVKHFTFQCCGENLNDYPKLKNWYTRCASLPGFDENEEGATALAVTVAGLLEEPLWQES